MSVETAVIPVAGAGSRVFPLTTAIEKCMLPIYAGDDLDPDGQPLSRSLVDFMVADCAAAGLKRIIFITTPRGQQQLHDYFGPEIPAHMKDQLLSLGKTGPLDAEQQRRESYGLQFEYILQPPKPYGTTVPLHLAQTALASEKHFALMGGDDFVYHRDGTSEMAAAIEGWETSGADHAIMGLPVLRKNAPKYGILQTEHGRLTAVDEKPPLERVTTKPIANISRYLLSDGIWDYINEEMAQDRNGAEHYITYPIAAALADGQSFHVHPVTGYYMDGGSFEGLRQAGNFIAENPPLPRQQAA
jgi:UTP--glucose-1-phosphate uridylyltransferase